MLNYLPPKSMLSNDGSGEVFKNENKGIVYSICRVSISDITRDTIIFSVKQLGLRLIVLLKIMVSPLLYQTIDTPSTKCGPYLITSSF